MIAPPIASASASAASDLPLAVGPAISTASNFMHRPFKRKERRMSDIKEIARFEALAEEAYTTQFDTRAHDAKACCDDALYNLQRAIDIAEMRGLVEDVARLKKRSEHIRSAYAR